MRLQFGKYLIWFLTLNVVFWGQNSSLFAQVAISPTTVFISKSTHFGNFSVQNTSNSKQEVSIQFKFGYAATDSVGNLYMKYDDSLNAKRYSIAGWVHAFPRSFTLNPSQTQTIRIMARPPSRLPDGMLWTRMFVTSNPQSSEVGTGNKNNVSANINFKFVQVTTVFYNNGGAKTGINIKNVSLRKNSDNINFLAQVDQTGNTPFLGTVYLKIYNDQGKIVTTNSLMTTIYFNEIIKLNVAKNQFSPGEYKAELTFKSGRKDIDRKDVVNAQSVSKSVKFRIQ